ncbi:MULTISPECIES: type I restriction endonuclease [Cyanophyceae]|uniref:Type I restriction enzyme HsdR N-terminal domain-containing protein n=1 Tax=Leptolyngbya subtilissima DQ-A4 TaxID=2933933 RepID=A0ABV0K1U0_9CYAN|nr:type I restriction endonuclease [Nodosilinea sp. FACHB-141]MBD2111525.1 restriction endonuclease subunit R [Nodosilinea sp. FACHB-141]
MAQTIAARKVKLHDLKTKFGLQQVHDDAFFTEWQHDLPELTVSEQRSLDRIKQNYLYLLEYPVMESIVKMVVLSPLLDLAGFYEPPFRVDGETSIQVAAEDEGDIIQGAIDVVVIQGQLWVTVIEAKNSEFSITKAIPQALAYMLAAPNSEKPAFGVVLNGSEFLFLKLVPGEAPRYAAFDLFSLLNRGNNLYSVLRCLKRFRSLLET